MGWTYYPLVRFTPLQLVDMSLQDYRMACSFAMFAAYRLGYWH
jgi:hypothetical protein